MSMGAAKSGALVEEGLLLHDTGRAARKLSARPTSTQKQTKVRTKLLMFAMGRLYLLMFAKSLIKLNASLPGTGTWLVVKFRKYIYRRGTT
jgi:hypothetical protein